MMRWLGEDIFHRVFQLLVWSRSSRRSSLPQLMRCHLSRLSRPRCRIPAPSPGESGAGWVAHGSLAEPCPGPVPSGARLLFPPPRVHLVYVVRLSQRRGLCFCLGGGFKRPPTLFAPVTRALSFAFSGGWRARPGCQWRGCYVLRARIPQFGAFQGWPFQNSNGNYITRGSKDKAVSRQMKLPGHYLDERPVKSVGTCS